MVLHIKPVQFVLAVIVADRHSGVCAPKLVFLIQHWECFFQKVDILRLLEIKVDHFRQKGGL
jgi:hypothetical protein